MEMTQAGGKTLARNNGTKESCTDEVVIYEQMLVFLTGMSRNIKIKKNRFKKDKMI